MIQELDNPMPKLMKKMPTMNTMKEDYGIDVKKKESKLTQHEKDIVAELKELLTSERKAFINRKSTLQANYPKLFGLIWGQCTPTLQQELQSMPKYKESYEQRDCLWLLNELKRCSSGSDDTQHEVVTFVRRIRTLFTTRQRESESLQDMSDRLDSQVQSLKLIGGTLHPKYLVEAYSKEHPGKSADEVKVAIEDKIIAILTIEGANETKYSAVKRHLANQKVNGIDIYPTSKSQVLTLLAEFVTGKEKKPNNNRRYEKQQSAPDSDDTSKVNVSFFQQKAPPVDGPPVAGTNGVMEENIRCFKCGRKGHYSNNCSVVPASGFQGFQHYLFSQNHSATRAIMKESWILLDSGSTFSSMANHHMLTKMENCTPITSFTNGGQLTYDCKGSVVILPKIEAYFNGAAIANIVSLHEVVTHYRVTMDSSQENAIHVHLADHTLVFKDCGDGLYFVDLMNIEEHKINPLVIDYSAHINL